MPTAVDLLVPNYNGSRFLETTLRSLLAQDHPAFRVVLVDNASTDRSVEIASELRDPRLTILRHDDHVTLQANFNRAIGYATAPYLATCASDELYEPGWASALAEQLDRHPRAFTCICKADSVDEHGRVYLAPEERYKHSFWPPGDGPVLLDRSEQVRRLQRGNYFTITLGLFRTAALREIGPLNDTCTQVVDWELLLRGLFAGWDIVGVARPLGHYRRHAGMTSRKLASTLRRFEEERWLCEWAAREGFAAGLLPSDVPDYTIHRRIVLSEFAHQLAAGDREGARKLAGFLASGADAPTRRLGLVMGALVPMGTLAGRGLLMGREVALELIRRSATA